MEKFRKITPHFHLRIEALAFFIFIIWIASEYSLNGWFFALFFLTPDLSMIPYVFNPEIGALSYNIFHSYYTGIAIFLFGELFFESKFVIFVGLLLLAHSTLDRAIGFGLKYSDRFKHTHLDAI